jgi:acetyl-CoA carboxylase biotin carboxyl carrier protein
MNFKEIQELIKIVEESNLTTIELEKDGLRLILKKENTQKIFSEKPPEVESAAKGQYSSEVAQTINAPIVGTFYASSSPESEPFVQTGSRVKKGDTLCIIEAMKLMNEIEADEDLEIVKVFVQDGQMVEYDQPLFAVNKT